jgi:hypothetical protein
MGDLGSNRLAEQPETNQALDQVGNPARRNRRSRGPISLTSTTPASESAGHPSATPRASTLTANTYYPSTTDPSTTDPSTTDPSTTDPSATDPSATDPGATDPGATDPGATDPGATDYSYSPTTTADYTASDYTTDVAADYGRSPTDITTDTTSEQESGDALGPGLGVGDTVETTSSALRHILTGATCTSEQVRRLAEAVASLVDQPVLGDLGATAALADDVTALARATQVLAVEMARRVRAADVYDATATGVRSTVVRAGWTPGQASRTTRLGAFLDTYPNLTGALRAGTITRDDVRAIEHATRRLTRIQRRQVVDWLLSWAPNLDSTGIKVAAQAAADHLRPRDADEQEQQDHDDRRLTFTRFRGMVMFEGQLPALEGEAFANTVAAYAEKLRAEGDGLSVAQRSADGLTGIVSELNSTGAVPSRNGTPAIVSVLIPIRDADRIAAGRRRCPLPLPNPTQYSGSTSSADWTEAGHSCSTDPNDLNPTSRTTDITTNTGSTTGSTTGTTADTNTPADTGSTTADINTNTSNSTANTSNSTANTSNSTANTSNSTANTKGNTTSSRKTGHSPNQGAGVIVNGSTLGDAAARFLLCCADLAGTIVATESPVGDLLSETSLEPLAMGRTIRLATTAQRRAMAIRDRGCVIPGCTVKADACQTHHVTEWAQGGNTDIDDMALLCWAHHRQVDLIAGPCAVIPVTVHTGQFSELEDHLGGDEPSYGRSSTHPFS